MSKATKIWLVTAVSAIVMGSIMFGLVMAAYNWDFTMLSTEEFETNTYEIKEEFSGISINTDTADILLAASGDNVCRVICHEQKNVKHSVGVEDGTLTVNVIDERKWYEYIGINIDTTQITVYLPEAEYTSLAVKESTGDIQVESISQAPLISSFQQEM